MEVTNNPSSYKTLKIENLTLPHELGGDDYFITESQYSDKFNQMFGNELMRSSRGTAGSIFAVTTAKNFFLNKTMDKKQYDTNLNRAMVVVDLLEPKQESTFNVVAKNANIQHLHKKTTVDFIKKSDPNMLSIIPDIQSSPSFCVIMLKNTKYFVVAGDRSRSEISADLRLEDSSQNSYYVRDCNDQYQYNFKERSDLIAYLKDAYSMDKQTTIGGLVFPEFSIVDHATLTQKFDDSYDSMINNRLNESIHTNTKNLDANHYYQHYQQFDERIADFGNINMCWKDCAYAKPKPVVKQIKKYEDDEEYIEQDLRYIIDKEEEFDFD